MTGLFSEIHTMHMYPYSKPNYIDQHITRNEQHSTIMYHPLPPVAPYYPREDESYLTKNGSFYNDIDLNPKNATKSALYKTELCKRYTVFGTCRYGAKCQFAHGHGELRHVTRHPKYKTTKCKSFWGTGHCPYGTRCRFIHEELEAFSSSASTYACHNLLSSMRLSLTDYPEDPLSSQLPLYIGEISSYNSQNEPTITSHPLKDTIWRSDISSYSKNQNCESLSASSLTACSSEDDDLSYPDLKDAIDALLHCSVNDCFESDEPVECLVLDNNDINEPNEQWSEYNSMYSLADSNQSEEILENMEKVYPTVKNETSPRLQIFERFH